MSSDQLRILELRQRIAEGGAPYLYAQLAEAYRRARDLGEAVACCQSCLDRFPHYLSIRLILGRALAEMGRLDDAAAEFQSVLRQAPDNLTAIRDLAEIELRRGRIESAVTYYQRALALFRGDADLEARVSALLRQLERPIESEDKVSAEQSASAPANSAVDFEAILTSLGASGQALPPLMEMLLARPTSTVLQSLASVRTQLTNADSEPAEAHPHGGPLADLSNPARPPLDERARRTIAALERWLTAAHSVDAARRADPNAHRPA